MADHDGLPVPKQETAVGRLRRVRRAGPTLLIDCSGSMAATDGGELRRIDRLARVLAQLLSTHRLQALLAFNDFVSDLALSGHISVPEPYGGTNLTLALMSVRDLTVRPTRLIVLSDGLPNDPLSALDVARSLVLKTDAYFVGSDHDSQALRFMRDLAEAGAPGGTSGHFDLSQPERVAAALRRQLTDQSGWQGERS